MRHTYSSVECYSLKCTFVHEDFYLTTPRLLSSLADVFQNVGNCLHRRFGATLCVTDVNAVVYETCEYTDAACKYMLCVNV